MVKKRQRLHMEAMVTKKRQRLHMEAMVAKQRQRLHMEAMVVFFLGFLFLHIKGITYAAMDKNGIRVLYETLTFSLFHLGGTLGLFFLWPNSPQFGHLNFPRTNFFAFSVSFSLVFLPLPPSRHPLILFFLCRPTDLLRRGAHTSSSSPTCGQKLWSPSGSTLLV
jgi:hypothetical protein